MDDLFIHRLATSCPNLTRLDLGSDGVVSLPTRVTLEGLITLAKHCRRLQNVGLFVGCSDIQYWYERISQNNPETTHLSVGCSTVDVDDIDIMAKFLSKLFPVLKDICYQSKANLDSDDEADGRWYSVLEMVKKYNNVSGEQKKKEGTI
jgi:hypothetical protein